VEKDQRILLRKLTSERLNKFLLLKACSFAAHSLVVSQLGEGAVFLAGLVGDKVFEVGSSFTCLLVN
jgi:hypothetical protein